MAVNSSIGAIPDPSTEWMHSTFAFLHLHDVLLLLVIIILLAALGGGPMLKAALKWVTTLLHGSTEQIVNILPQGGEMSAQKIPAYCEACGLITDPSKCIAHQAEHERSMRNEEQYKELWLNYGKLRDEMQSGFKEIRLTVMEGQSAILAALGKKPPWMEKENH